MGFLSILQLKEKMTSKWLKRIIQTGLLLILATGLSEPVYFMITSHPYQNIYFNAFAGSDMAQIKSRFELDYWGLSYREALEYILEKDPSTQIRVRVAEDSGYFTKDILSKEDRQRLFYADSLKSADYFIGTYRWHPSEYSADNDFFSIKIGNDRIVVVYKLQN